MNSGVGGEGGVAEIRWNDSNSWFRFILSHVLSEMFVSVTQWIYTESVTGMYMTL